MSPQPSALASRRPQRRDAAQNRGRILAAAHEVFAEQGLSVTLDNIAHQAGVGVGTIYRNYPNKGTLLAEVMADITHTAIATAQEALTFPDAWEGLRHFLHETVGLQARHRALREIMFSPDKLGAAGHAQAQELTAVLQSLTERGHAQGKVRADITHQDLRVLHLMLSALLERSAGQPELWIRYAELFLEAVSVRPPPRPLPPAPGEEDVARLLAWNPAKENPA